MVKIHRNDTVGLWFIGLIMHHKIMFVDLATLLVAGSVRKLAGSVPPA